MEDVIIDYLDWLLAKTADRLCREREDMPKLKRLFQKAWTAVSNPGQDERVAIIQAAIEKGLRVHRLAFDLDQVIEPIDCTVTDVRVATEAYYQGLLERFWASGIPDSGRQKTLGIVADKLRIDPQYLGSANIEIAVAHFGSKLGEFLEDGVLSREELASLSEVASFANASVPVFVRRHLSTEGLSLLRSLFAEAASTGVLGKSVWENLSISAERLGITPAELKAASKPIVRSFAEHVLADTKSDGRLSEKEEAYLDWLMSTFDFDATFEAYLHDEIAFLRDQTKLANGRIDPIAIPQGVNLKAGELLYVCNDCSLKLIKRLKGGDKVIRHDGRILLTDSRVMFESSTRSAQVTYRSIISWDASTAVVRLSVANKPELTFHFARDPGRLLKAKLSTLIQLQSQQLTKKVEGRIDRHIPRDIRQRVWQRYGGKCVECAATEYLEFDHIVPVAKGGSNSEQNVQLLCRKCNLTKSDKI